MAAEEQIERILIEASAVNKRIEVIEAAHKYLEAYPTLDRVEAFQQAYREECGPEEELGILRGVLQTFSPKTVNRPY